MSQTSIETKTTTNVNPLTNLVNDASETILPQITEKERAIIIEAYKKSQKEKAALKKANQSELAKNRSKLDRDVKVALLNFNDVFNTVIKKEFSFLTARPTLAKVNEGLEDCINILFSLCSDSFALSYFEEKKTIVWARLPRLITDKKLLYTFATTSQRKDDKVWSARSIIDLLFKALCAKDKDYELALRVRK